MQQHDTHAHTSLLKSNQNQTKPNNNNAMSVDLPFVLAPVRTRPLWMQVLRIPVLIVLMSLRCIGMTLICLVVAIVFPLLHLFGLLPPQTIQRWQRGISVGALRTLRFLLGVRVRYIYVGSKHPNQPRASGLLVANHIGLLDDLAILSEIGTSQHASLGIHRMCHGQYLDRTEQSRGQRHRKACYSGACTES